MPKHNATPVVVGYTRVSTKDQSNFSLSAQSDSIYRHCRQFGYVVKAIFEDDGQSAKDFDRRSWKKLEDFLKKTHKEIDYLVVMKYDRFSRNLMDSLSMIQQIEVKWDIKIISVMEPIGIPPESPFFFQIRTSLLLNAHVERLVIKERTIIGMRQGAKGGRFLGKAPFGYRNARDESNRPVIVIEEKEAKMIREIFRMFLRGTPQVVIKNIMKENGMKLQGKDSIYRIITRPTYAGLISITAHKDEDGHFVKGLHEAIIDEDTWWKAQEFTKRTGQKRQHKYDDEVPMRGLLRCTCGNPFTASHTKGRSKYYWYYECHAQNGAHRRSFNASKLHQQFLQILQICSLSEAQMGYIRESVAENLRKAGQKNLGLLKELKRELGSYEKRINSLESKFIGNDISADVYKKWRNTYTIEQSRIKEKINEIDPAKEVDIWAVYNKEMEACGDLARLYESASTEQKTNIFKVGFENSLIYDGTTYRTTYLNPLFRSKALILKQKRLLIYQQPSVFSRENPLGEGFEAIIEPARQLFEWIRNVRAA